MNHLKWAGWGVVDIEQFDRQQRRNYLKKVRLELADKGFELHPGGSKKAPWYKAVNSSTGNKHIVAGCHYAFQKICERILHELGEVREDQEDGRAPPEL